MAIPLIIAGVAALAGAGITAYVAASEGEKNRAMSEKHTNELKSLLDKVQAPTFQGQLTEKDIQTLGTMPSIGDFIANAEPPMMAGFMAASPGFAQFVMEREPKVREYIAAMPPVLAMQIFESSPKVAATMYEHMPEVANFYAEQSPIVAKYISDEKPEVIKADSEDAIFAREAQRNALQQLSKVGTEGDTIAQSELMRGMNRLASQESGQRGALTEEMARRGQLSSGRELLMKLATQQASGQQAAELQMGSFEESQKRRLEALAQAGSLGSQMFDQEVGMERDNASIINAFNMRNTDSMRKIEENRVNAENMRLARDAQARQAFEQQRVMDFNQWQQREIAAGRRLEELSTAEYNAWNARETAAQRNYEQRQADVKNVWQMRDEDYKRGLEDSRVSDINAWQARNAAQQNATNIANAGFATSAANANASASASVGVANANAYNNYYSKEADARRNHQKLQNDQARINAQNTNALTLGERDRLDRLAQQDYNNEMARIGHVSGVNTAEMNARLMESQGNTLAGQAIGAGISGAGQAGAQWYYQDQKTKK